MPDDAHLIGYSDDIAAIIVARNVEEAKSKVNLEDKELKLATEKMELIFLTSKCTPLKYDTTLTTRKVINYLAIRLDLRLTLSTRRYAVTNTAKVISLLSWLIANIT